MEAGDGVRKRTSRVYYKRQSVQRHIYFQNMHFIMPNENQRTCPQTYDELETVKQSIIKCKDITDNANYDDVYRYHPGGQLRLDFDKKSTKKYIRYTDYETSQVGVDFTDKNGTWKRTSFTSMADDVVITKLNKSSSGSKLNLTLSLITFQLLQISATVTKLI